MSRVVSGPLAEGWPQGAPYDVIVLEGATEVVPHALCQQLKDGGRLVCVLGSGPGSKAMLYRRSGGEIGRPGDLRRHGGAPAGLRENAGFRLLIPWPVPNVAGNPQAAAFPVGGDRQGVLTPRQCA